jgi:hypothetical protein
MGSHHEALPHTSAAALPPVSSFAELSARRWLIIGGIALIVVGLIIGDLFAVFVLHQNAGRIGDALLAAVHAVNAQDSGAVWKHFTTIGYLLENRGTKVDTHVHLIDFGYIALLLALIQPYIALDERRKRQLARLFITGAVLLPVGVFLIHYVGLAYSPLEVIGWASLVADFGGVLVIVACAGELVGLWKYSASDRKTNSTDELLNDGSWSRRALLAGGTLLVMAGFLHGSYYAAVDLSNHEHREVATLRAMIDHAATGNLAAASQAVNDYGALQAERAVKIAAHSHIIEFGLLAMLLAFVQPYVFLSERWKRRWVLVMMLGSVVLPVSVLAERQWGLVAGGVADVGGLLVIIALMGMLVGVVRYTGRLDAQSEVAR